MTDEEVVNSGLDLARKIYSVMGYQVEKGFKFYESSHPQEEGIWHIVVMSFDHINGTDLQTALESIQDE